MNRQTAAGLLLSIVLTGTGVLHADPPTAGGSVLDRFAAEDAAPGPTLKFTFAARRITQLEQQIAARVSKLRLADPMTARAIQADVNVRLIARALLKSGSNPAAGPDAPIALLYGVTLARGADDLAAVLVTLPQVVAQARAPGSTDAQLTQARTLLEAIDRFNQASETPDDLPATMKAGDIDAYLQRHLGPLATVLKAAGAADPATTWLKAPAGKTAAAPAHEIGGAEMDALEQRIQAAGVPTATKTEMLWIAGVIRSGLAQPDLRPKVGGVFEMLNRAAGCAEALGAAAGLDPQTAGELKQRLHTAVVLIRDPRTRSSATQRLEQIETVTRLAGRIAQLDQQAAPVEPLRNLLAAAIALQAGGDDAQAAGLVTDALDRLTGTMLRYRATLGENLQLDLRKIALGLRKDYQAHEVRVLGAMGGVVNRPGDLGTEAWRNELTALDAEVQQLRRVQRVPDDVQRLSRFKPRPAATLFRELRDAAGKPADPQDPRTLEKLERTLEVIDPLPLEAMIRGGDPALSQITQGTQPILVEQIERLRQDWASAWAGGGDPTQAAQRLGLMRKLLEAVELTRGFSDLGGVTERLNRWAGWEADAAAIGPLLAATPERVSAACRMAAAGNWSGLDEALKQIERDASLPLLVGTADRQIGAAMAKLPGGATGVISQCLYPPGAGAWGAGQRRAWATLSLSITEAAEPGAARDAASAAAAEIAADLLKNFQDSGVTATAARSGG